MSGSSPGADPDVDVLIERARRDDAGAIASVHVRCWRDTYPGILADEVLISLRPDRLLPSYAREIGREHLLVARVPSIGVVGFTGVAPARSPHGDGEVETLYVLADWQGRGLGRALLRSGLRALAARGCRRPFVWVLEANPSRHFYARQGARLVGRGTTVVGGRPVPQLAYAWPERVGLAPLAGRPGP